MTWEKWEGIGSTKSKFQHNWDAFVWMNAANCRSALGHCNIKALKHWGTTLGRNILKSKRVSRLIFVAFDNDIQRVEECSIRIWLEGGYKQNQQLGRHTQQISRRQDTVFADHWKPNIKYMWEMPAQKNHEQSILNPCGYQQAPASGTSFTPQGILWVHDSELLFGSPTNLWPH